MRRAVIGWSQIFDILQYKGIERPTANVVVRKEQVKFVSVEGTNMERSVQF